MQDALDLSDFVAFFRWLDSEGFAFAVIGGCAVGAYARVEGTTVVSADLDIYVSPRTLEEVLQRVQQIGARVEQVPHARTIPVAVLRWQEHEINLLTAGSGLPAPEVVIRAAREFHLTRHDEHVPVADPFDLLINKLAVGRDKDQPHIAILLQFIEEEIVAQFSGAGRPRLRHAPAKRLLECLKTETLPESLGRRLLPLAREPADYRFLVHHLGSLELTQALVAQTGDDALRQELLSMAAKLLGDEHS